MRKWYKYYLDCSINGIKTVGIDSSFDDHSRAMGNFDPDAAYDDKALFFKKYFFGYQYNRLEHYNDFLEKHLNKEDEILSIASGRCANELWLIEKGYKVTCSDIDVMNAYKKTKELFPSLNWIKIDILQEPVINKFDSIVCLSLIYLFDMKKLSLFFSNIAQSLKPGGYLILDSAGAPDNMLSFSIHDIYLKFETILKGLLKCILKGRMTDLVIKDFGYRRTDKEIIEVAAKYGLRLAAQKNYAFLTEFRRSLIFNKLIKDGTVIEKFFAILGRKIPYIRMYKFKKIG